MAKKQKELLEKAQWAQKIVEESGLDEKYRPALFQILLASESAAALPTQTGRPRSAKPVKAKSAAKVTAPGAIRQLY